MKNENGSVTKQKHLDFSKAKIFALSLNLKSKSGWEEWIKLNELPINIPKHPAKSLCKKGMERMG